MKASDQSVLMNNFEILSGAAAYHAGQWRRAESIE